MPVRVAEPRPWRVVTCLSVDHAVVAGLSSGQIKRMRRELRDKIWTDHNDLADTDALRRHGYPPGAEGVGDWFMTWFITNTPQRQRPPRRLRVAFDYEQLHWRVTLGVEPEQPDRRAAPGDEAPPRQGDLREALADGRRAFTAPSAEEIEETLAVLSLIAGTWIQQWTIQLKTAGAPILAAFAASFRKMNNLHKIAGAVLQPKVARAAGFAAQVEAFACGFADHVLYTMAYRAIDPVELVIKHFRNLDDALVGVMDDDGLFVQDFFGARESAPPILNRCKPIWDRELAMLPVWRASNIVLHNERLQT